MSIKTDLTPYLREEEIRQFVQSNRYLMSHQEIIDGLGLSSHYYVIIARLFPYLPKRKFQKYLRRKVLKSRLATVDVLRIKEVSNLGKVLLEPPNWSKKTPTPKIIINKSKIPEVALQNGNRILVRILSNRLNKNGDEHLEGQFLRVIKPKMKKCFGIIKKDKEKTSIIVPNSFSKEVPKIDETLNKKLSHGDIVEIDYEERGQKFDKTINGVSKVSGPSKGRELFSFLSKKEFSLPIEFPPAVHKELLSIKRRQDDSTRKDLTHLPFVTIDPVDAKDHDDAIYAFFPKNNPKGGTFCEIWIAIADVASYVIAGSNIDQEAMRRANSTYFLDSVIPMLPEKISNDLCSLQKNKVRNSIILKISLSSNGDRISYEFIKGKVIVKHNFSYEKVETFQKEVAVGESPFLKQKQLIGNLYAANAILSKSSKKALHLQIPEPKLSLLASGKLADLNKSKILESNKIVENFMIAANVCVAEALSESTQPTIYRVHETPNPENINKLLKKIDMLGLKGQRNGGSDLLELNQILKLAWRNQVHDVTSLLILQSLTQAYYTTKPLGHFGLNLKKYVHFTSPIRRYADLVTHRLLYHHLGWENGDKHPADANQLELTCIHASTMERNSSLAERRTNQRYIASFMEDSVGKVFDGIVYSYSKYLVFFLLREFGIQGACQKKKYYKQNHKRKKRKSLEKYELVKIGDKIKVKLIATNTIAGELIYELE